MKNDSQSMVPQFIQDMRRSFNNTMASIGSSAADRASLKFSDMLKSNQSAIIDVQSSLKSSISNYHNPVSESGWLLGLITGYDSSITTEMVDEYIHSYASLSSTSDQMVMVASLLTMSLSTMGSVVDQSQDGHSTKQYTLKDLEDKYQRMYRQSCAIIAVCRFGLSLKNGAVGGLQALLTAGLNFGKMMMSIAGYALSGLRSVSTSAQAHQSAQREIDTVSDMNGVLESYEHQSKLADKANNFQEAMGHTPLGMYLQLSEQQSDFDADKNLGVAVENVSDVGEESRQSLDFGWYSAFIDVSREGDRATFEELDENDVEHCDKRGKIK